jgi:hypothetical protein
MRGLDVPPGDMTNSCSETPPTLSGLGQVDACDLAGAKEGENPASWVVRNAAFKTQTSRSKPEANLKKQEKNNIGGRILGPVRFSKRCIQDTPDKGIYPGPRRVISHPSLIEQNENKVNTYCSIFARANKTPEWRELSVPSNLVGRG